MIEGVFLSLKLARDMVRLFEIAYGEGQGLEDDDLMLWIAKTYPQITEEFSSLPWATMKPSK